MKNSTKYNKYTCDICGTNFYNKYRIINEINNSYIDCFELINDYYLDENDWNYKSCYYTCKSCEIGGNENNHNCLSCKDDFLNQSKISNSNFMNCYKLDLSELIKNRTELIQNIIYNLIDGFNINDINSDTDKKIVDENIIIKLTSTNNQKNNENLNDITMDFGQCENILKVNYNISKNDSLYILQIIYEEKGMKIPKVEYEVYYPLDNNNELTKLNLTLCKDTRIEISVPIKINGTLDLYNPKSDYYNDICSKTTSECGTDKSLKDRRSEFVYNNMTLCEENCELIEYNYEKKKAKCSCDIKLSITPNYDIKFNKNDFFKSFTDINNILNLSVMKCYKIVLKIKSLKNNYGFIIIFFILLIYFLSVLYLFF